MNYKNYNMKDKFDETAEVPFNAEYQDAKSDEPIKKKKKRIKFKINPIKKDEYSKWYIVLMISPIIASILCLIKLKFVYSIVYLTYSIIPFLVWNNLCLIDRFLEDSLILSNFRNLERAFLKTSKLKSIYTNIEDVYTFSKKSMFFIILLLVTNQITNNILFLNFILNILLIVLILNNLTSMQIMSIKGYDDDIKFINFVYRISLYLFFIILIIKFLLCSFVVIDYSMLFISCFYYTLKVYIMKK